MKILTWNINGIRSVRKDRSLKSLFDSLDADILCLQETKITREMLDEETAIVDGYNSYFGFSKVRSGYSGVATFCRDDVTPLKAENRIELDNDDCNLTNEDIESLNAEGRVVLTEHVDNDNNHVVIMNLYCPRADLENKERTKFKLQFFNLVEQKCRSLLAQNKSVIVLGDFNVSHKLIDHCDPDDPEIFDSNPSRQWASTFILDTRDLSNTTAMKFVDSFRHFHPYQKSAFTGWSTMTGARQTNYGTRIDYVFSSIGYFEKQFKDCVIRPDIEGSDHCPVVATLKEAFKTGGKPPALCTKYMPEFAGKQQKLNMFFQKKDIQKSENIMTEELNGDNVVKSKDSLDEPKKIAQKRAGSSQTGNQVKRPKTSSSNNSQGSIFQFLSKPSKVAKVQENLLKLENNEEQSCSPKAEDIKVHHPNDQSSQNSSQPSKCCSEDNSAAVVAQWKHLLKGPGPAPLCSGHNETCVLRTVKNKGPNHGKQFYCCARPQGHSTNKEARCNFFKWKKK